MSDYSKKIIQNYDGKRIEDEDGFIHLDSEPNIEIKELPIEDRSKEQCELNLHVVIEPTIIDINPAEVQKEPLCGDNNNTLSERCGEENIDTKIIPNDIPNTITSSEIVPGPCLASPGTSNEYNVKTIIDPFSHNDESRIIEKKRSPDDIHDTTVSQGIILALYGMALVATGIVLSSI